MKQKLMFLILTMILILFSGIVDAKSPYGNMDLYYNGDLLPRGEVAKSNLDISEPFSVRVDATMYQECKLYIELTVIDKTCFELIDGPADINQLSSHVFETNETYTFEWTLKPTDEWAGGTIPVNIHYSILLPGDEGVATDSGFTIAYPYISTEYYESNTTAIQIDDTIAAPNSYVFTSIMVKNVTDLGSGDINLAFDPSVIHVTNVTSGDGNALDVQTYNINNTTGLVQITALDASEAHNGDVVFAIVNFHAVGEYPDSTSLTISSSELVDYTSYGIIEHSITNGSFSIIDNEPPVITSTITTSDVILNDNGRSRAPNTNYTVLNITAIDSGSGVVNVTVDLSPIGGSGYQVMERIGSTDAWILGINAIDGINLTHELVITATDRANNTNTSVIELTVLLRGDVVRDGNLNSADVLYIAKYLVGKESMPSLLVSDISPAKGDGKITSADALYLAKHLVGKEEAP
ncbi:MAG: sarcinarray family MAST domain-containing protein [Methanosarcinaceae archaeon]